MTIISKTTNYGFIKEKLSPDSFEEFDRFCDIVIRLHQQASNSKENTDRVVRQTKRHILSRWGKVLSLDIVGAMMSTFNDIFNMDINLVNVDHLGDTVPPNTRIEANKKPIQNLLPLLDKKDETVTVPVTKTEDKPDRGFLYANVIMCKGASILVHKIGDTYFLPGGFTKFNESGRKAAIRYLKEQCSMYAIDAKEFDIYSTYENMDENFDERYMIVNFLYNSKTKHYASSVSTNTSVYVDFDKILDMNVYPLHKEVIKHFILK